MHAYCLFCETQKCALIAQTIEKTHGIRCISPQIIQRKWVKGVCQEERHDWLQGYIFLYSEEPITPVFEIHGIIRWLGHDELKHQDLEFAEALLRQDGVMGNIRLAEVGDRCVVADPVWENLNGTIVKLDRGRKRCCVAFEFAKTKRTVWVGYDLVKRVDEDPEQAGTKS